MLRMRTYLDPMVDLDVFIRGVKMQSLGLIPVAHLLATGKLNVELHLSRANPRVAGKVSKEVGAVPIDNL